MYELKTLLPEYDIQLPTCMYPMKMLHSSDTVCNTISDVANSGLCNSQANKTPPIAFNVKMSVVSPMSKENVCVLDLDNLSEQIQKVLKTVSDAETITFRQENVLQQLQELKQQMAKIRATLGLCQKVPQSEGSTEVNDGLREEPLHDIVVNGHPNFIPYALLALKNAWRDLLTIDVKPYTHSTMSDIGKEALDFERKLVQVKVDAVSQPKVNISLIWKNCEHTEMISSPTMYVPIYGEVNIIRYFGRVGPAAYRYEDSPFCNEIDAVLDICYQLLRCTTPQTKAAMLRLLNLRLGNQTYFGGDRMSVADIGVHSSFKRMPTITPKDLTPALREWQKRVKLVTQL